MKQQRECQQAKEPDPLEVRDVLTNLQNLMDAENLFKVAESLRQRGQLHEAMDCYKTISKLCPGSHVAEQAHQASLNLLGDWLDGVSPTAACEGHKKVRHCKPGVQEQVKGLMKACRLAVEAGRYHKAATLAREAYALDAKQVEADPLVYKMHLVDCSMQKGCLIGAMVGAAVTQTGYGFALGAAASGSCPLKVARSGCCMGKCCKACPETCCKACGDCKNCREGKCCCCEAKNKGCQSCCSCSPGRGKPMAGSCKIHPGCCKAGCCAGGCRTNEAEECEEQHCPAQQPSTSCPSCPTMDHQAPTSPSPCIPHPPYGCPSGCPRQQDQDNSVQLVPMLPPVDATVVQGLEAVQAEAEEQEASEDLTIVEEDGGSKPKWSFLFGVNLLPSAWGPIEMNCGDDQATSDQVEHVWQMKVGPWTCRIQRCKPE